jgi:hypothetical protein
MKALNVINSNIAKTLITLLVLVQLAACNHDAVTALNEGQGNTNNNNTTQTTGAAARLSWAAPVDREDSNPIAMGEIDGYRIYYRTAQDSYTQYIEVNDAYTTEISLNDANLPNGAYFVVMTTVDISGRESSFSGEVAINV